MRTDDLAEMLKAGGEGRRDAILECAEACDVWADQADVDALRTNDDTLVALARAREGAFREAAQRFRAIVEG